MQLARSLAAAGRRNFSASTAAAAPTFKTVGVIGLGLMGHGIAQVTAAAGFKVVAIDSNAAAVTKGTDMIKKSLETTLSKAVAKGAMDKAAADAKMASVLANLTTSTDRDALKPADLVIEAAPEQIELKKSLYNDLATRLRTDTVLASNTSGLEIGELANFYGRKDRVIGLHYFNPVQMMALCEVIGTPETPKDVIDAAVGFGKAQGKTPVLAADSAGFIVNRLLVPYIAQAVAMRDRGVASTADIDVAMKLGTGVPMGPLHLADYVGLDTTLFILKNWTTKYPGEPAFFIPKGLEEKVAAGKLGRKTGEGFYKWKGSSVVEPSD